MRKILWEKIQNAQNAGERILFQFIMDCQCMRCMKRSKRESLYWEGVALVRTRPSGTAKNVRTDGGTILNI